MTYSELRDKYLSHVDKCTRCVRSIAREYCSCPLGAQPIHIKEYLCIRRCADASNLTEAVAAIL